MQKSPLLTIAIPTYNRAIYLGFLLATLERELAPFADQVKVLVSDNASTDDTPLIVANFSSRMKNLFSIRNESNRGPDFNTNQCYSLSDTPYVWIMGDDDAPLTGTLRLILALLHQESPDLVYLPSRPTTDILHDHDNHTVNNLEAIQLPREKFASVLHVQMTFISGFILRKKPEFDAHIQNQLAITTGTSLIQLAWIFETLKRGDRFLICGGYPLMATAANSGGYSAFNVFMINHTQIVSALLSDQPAICKSIIRMTSWCHLPGLIWHIRCGSFGNFKMLDRTEITIPTTLTRTYGFRWLVQPIWTMPKPLAESVFFLSRIVTFSVRQYQRLILFPRYHSVKISQ